MGRLGQVHEVLGIPAPELVLLAVIENATASIRVVVPLATELLLDGVRQLHKLDGLRREDSQVERSLNGFPLFDLSVWNYDIVDILLLECWRQPNSFGDFTLCEALSTLSSLKNNVVPVDFVETIAAALDPDKHEVNRNVRLFVAGVEVLLHETDDDLSLFCNGQSELGIVKPSVVGVLLCV